jgi:hypothetical protein
LAQLQARIINGKPTVMITLTEKPNSDLSPAAQAKQQTRSLKKFLARLRRHTSLKKIPYIWHREATQRGTSHLHILMRLQVFVDQEWISDTWRTLTGSYIVWINTIKDDLATTIYVTKHVAKDPGKFGNCKRFFASDDWALPTVFERAELPDLGAPWGFVRESAAALMHKCLMRGLRADYSHPRAVIMRPDTS